MVNHMARQFRFTTTPPVNRLLLVPDLKVSTPPLGILQRLFHQRPQHFPLQQTGVLKFINQPVIKTRIETRINGQPRRARPAASQQKFDVVKRQLPFGPDFFPVMGFVISQ